MEKLTERVDKLEKAVSKISASLFQIAETIVLIKKQAGIQ